MNDLQSELSAFYADCGQRLAVCEADGQSSFKAWCGNAYEWDALTDLEQQRWNRFSASRNQRPGEIRALVKLAQKAALLLDAISELQDNALNNEAYGRAERYRLQYDEEEAALREILSDWRNNQ